MNLAKIIITIQIVVSILEVAYFYSFKNQFLIPIANLLMGLNQYFLINGVAKMLLLKKGKAPIKEILFSKVLLLSSIFLFYKINAHLLLGASLIYVVQLLLISFIIKKKKMYEK